MSSNKGDVDIGFDPLAWMNEEQSSDETQEESAKPATEATPEVDIVDSVEAAPAQEIKETVQAEEEIKQSETIDIPVASGDSYRVNLAGKTDISCAEQLKEELEEALHQSAAIILEAEAVERADGAALQLLTAFARKIEDTDREFIWEAPSDQLLAAANILGLKEALQLP